LQQAACAYVQQLFFRPDPTPFQVLGPSPVPRSSDQGILRLLMQLVHPDRQSENSAGPMPARRRRTGPIRCCAIRIAADIREESDARTALARAINRAAIGRGAADACGQAAEEAE
jgi:hypothetical protein